MVVVVVRLMMVMMILVYYCISVDVMFVRYLLLMVLERVVLRLGCRGW